jgi:hypothetical protein
VFYRGEGAVIDLGCLAGSSTHALATGLLDNPRIDHTRSRVHVYDLFRFEEYMRAAFGTIGEGGRAVGSSFLDVFERLTVDVSSVVSVHPGDFLRERWVGGDGRSVGGGVELLHIDIAKNWELEHHCASEMFASLLPGHSLLIQQDYFHAWCPWVALRMELLSEWCEFVARVPSGTAVFLVKEAIPERWASLDNRAALGVPEQCAMLDRCAGRHGAEGAAFLYLARSVHAVHCGMLNRAESCLVDALATRDAGEHVASEAAGIRAWIESKQGKAKVRADV